MDWCFIALIGLWVVLIFIGESVVARAIACGVVHRAIGIVSLREGLVFERIWGYFARRAHSVQANSSHLGLVTESIHRDPDRPAPDP